MKVLRKDAELAESDETVVIEGDYRFPPCSVVVSHLQPSAKRSTCPCKGVAGYYDVEVDGKRLGAAAWYYPDPKPVARQISGFVAIWKGVKVPQPTSSARSSPTATGALESRACSPPATPSRPTASRS